MAHDEIEATLRRRRKVKSEIFREVAKLLAVRLGAPILILVTVAGGLAFYDFGSSEKTTIWWFVVAIVVFLASFIHGEVSNNETRKLYRQIKQDLHDLLVETREEVTTIIERNVDPHVYVLRLLAQVRKEAALLIEDAIREKSQVDYYGSASLTPSPQDLRDATHSDSEEVSDVQRYHAAIEDLKSSGLRINRFIRLLEPERFKTRGKKTRVEYLRWLESQVALLRSNPNYYLYDARRAPPWGGSRSTILTNKGFLDIIGDGGAGLLIVSPRIAEMVREESRNHFWQAGADRNKPQLYSSDQAHLLQAMVQTLQRINADLETAQ